VASGLSAGADAGGAGGAGGAARAYLDHASTSPIRPAALEAMHRWIGAADPGRVHTEGRMARAALEDARDRVAALFGTRSRQVIFTSGATESINAATFGALASGTGRRVVMSAVEHSAVREASELHAGLRAGGIEPVGVNGTGVVDVDAIQAAVRGPDVALVQCQWANHEVGTLQPVAAVVAACRERGVLVHVDAAAAAGHVPIAFDEIGADLMSLSAHKLGGPRGIGVLLVRRGLRIPPLLVGGSQERARRGGLEDVAAAIGFGAAATELIGGLAEEADAARVLVAKLRSAALQIPDVEAYGPASWPDRLPHLLCIGIGGVEAEPVLIGLDQAGVAAHSGSSCSSESLEPSPVLEAMGVDAEHSLRLSVGWSSTEVDVRRAVRALPQVVGRLRALMAGSG
jgi:cysteine desulfurase